MITGVGRSTIMRRVAWIPSRPGMFRSMMMKSGSASRASFTPSSPSTASPTTSNPARTSALRSCITVTPSSSQISARSPCVFIVIDCPSRGARQRDDGFHPRAGCIGDIQFPRKVALDQHPDEVQPDSGVLPYIEPGWEPGTVIADCQSKLTFFLFQRYAHFHARSSPRAVFYRVAGQFVQSQCQGSSQLTGEQNVGYVEASMYPPVRPPHRNDGYKLFERGLSAERAFIGAAQVLAEKIVHY